MTIEQRRMSDPSKIEEMIAQEPDSKNRAMLLILNNINKALIENTATTREVAANLEVHIAKFEAHAAREQSLIDKGRGAWRIVAWVLGAAQIVALSLVSDGRKELRDIHDAQHRAEIKYLELESRVAIEEANRK